MWFWTMSRSARRRHVKVAAALDSNGLGDGNLDMVDMGAVPQRLEQGIGEPQRQQVLDRFLAEIMVDAEGPLLGKGSGDGVVDLAAGGEIAAQRLFQRQRTVGQVRPTEARPSMVGLNKDGAVDRKIASPGEQSPTAAANLEIFQTVSIDSDVAQAIEEALRDILLVKAFGRCSASACRAPLASSPSPSSVRAVPTRPSGSNPSASRP